MLKMQELKIGQRYEVQPKNFHRKFIGELQQMKGTSIIFKVENYEPCDQEKISKDKLVEVESLDVKKSIGNTYFFS